jgi:hypothetical protein
MPSVGEWSLDLAACVVKLVTLYFTPCFKIAVAVETVNQRFKMYSKRLRDAKHVTWYC